MKIGILGLGGIAHTVAKTLNQCDGLTIEAVASRSGAKAEEFKELYGAKKAYGSYEELYTDDDVELIYIATQMSEHKYQMLRAIENNKAILCEKSFCINEAEAREVLEYAKEKKVLVAEAIWTRYMPSRKVISDLVNSGIIGKVTSLDSNLGYHITQNERIVSAKLGGGAMLDLGVYTLNFALMATEGDTIDKMSGSANIGETGVDLQSTMNLVFKSGVTASLYVDAQCNTHRLSHINGNKGYIEVVNTNNPEIIRVYDNSRPAELLKEIIIEQPVSGYEYQFYAVKKALEENKLEVEEMPHAEILRVMRLMDIYRKSWGVKLSDEE